jgi:hypothetical protein
MHVHWYYLDMKFYDNSKIEDGYESRIRLMMLLEVFCVYFLHDEAVKSNAWPSSQSSVPTLPKKT